MIVKVTAKMSAIGSACKQPWSCRQENVANVNERDQEHKFTHDSNNDGADCIAGGNKGHLAGDSGYPS